VFSGSAIDGSDNRSGLDQLVVAVAAVFLVPQTGRIRAQTGGQVELGPSRAELSGVEGRGPKSASRMVA